MPKYIVTLISSLEIAAHEMYPGKISLHEILGQYPYNQFKPFFNGRNEDQDFEYIFQYKKSEMEGDADADLESKLSEWSSFVEGHWEYD